MLDEGAVGGLGDGRAGGRLAGPAVPDRGHARQVVLAPVEPQHAAGHAGAVEGDAHPRVAREARRVEPEMVDAARRELRQHHRHVRVVRIAEVSSMGADLEGSRAAGVERATRRARRCRRRPGRAAVGPRRPGRCPGGFSRGGPGQKPQSSAQPQLQVVRLAIIPPATNSTLSASSSRSPLACGRRPSRPRVCRSRSRICTLLNRPFARSARSWHELSCTSPSLHVVGLQRAVADPCLAVIG